VVGSIGWWYYVYRMGQWQCRKVSKGVAETTDCELDKSIEQGAATPLNPRETNEGSWLEVDPVEAMVEGVKRVICLLFHEP
jgi:hypothetical protein